VRYLTVLYDPECGLCARLGQWVQEQPKWIALRLVPSNLGPRLYPDLAARIGGEELVVVSLRWRSCLAHVSLRAEALSAVGAPLVAAGAITAGSLGICGTFG
jgi:hypothetical protein